MSHAGPTLQETTLDPDSNRVRTRVDAELRISITPPMSPLRFDPARLHRLQP